MKVLLVSAISLLTIASCTRKELCAFEQKVVDTAANGIAVALQCSKPEEIKKDLTKIIEKMSFCDSPQTTSALSTACSAVGSLLVDQLASAAIPKDWDCSAENAKAALKSAVDMACQTVLP